MPACCTSRPTATIAATSPRRSRRPPGARGAACGAPAIRCRAGRRRGELCGLNPGDERDQIRKRRGVRRRPCIGEVPVHAARRADGDRAGIAGAAEAGVAFLGADRLAQRVEAAPLGGGGAAPPRATRENRRETPGPPAGDSAPTNTLGDCAASIGPPKLIVPENVPATA